MMAGHDDACESVYLSDSEGWTKCECRVRRERRERGPSYPPMTLSSTGRPPLIVNEKHRAGIKPTATLLAQCEAYLSGRACTLWGQAFEIISPKGRAEAAEWLAQQVAGVLVTDSKR